MYCEDLVQEGRRRGSVTHAEVENSIMEAQNAMYEGMRMKGAIEMRAQSEAEHYGLEVEQDLKNALAAAGITITGAP